VVCGCRDHLVVVGENGNKSIGAYSNIASSSVTVEEQLYVVLTDCPAAIDSSGIGFTGLGSDFCGTDQSEMPWGKYLGL